MKAISLISLIGGLLIIGCGCGNPKQARELEQKDFNKITGTAFAGVVDVFNAKLHNGTDFNIQYVDVEITLKEKQQKRRYRLNVQEKQGTNWVHGFIQPYTDATFRADTGDFFHSLKQVEYEYDPQQWSWRIVGAIGKKE